MSGKVRSAQVHRFRDCVAIHVGAGDTVYFTPKAARLLARALYRAARDVDLRPFAESDLPPWTIVEERES
jgi:hypothetical protein